MNISTNVVDLDILEQKTLSIRITPVKFYYNLKFPVALSHMILKQVLRSKVEVNKALRKKKKMSPKNFLFFF